MKSAARYGRGSDLRGFEAASLRHYFHSSHRGHSFGLIAASFRFVSSAVHVLVPFAILIGSGCQSSRPEWRLHSDGPVWPASPEVPRVKFLNELRGSEGFAQSAPGRSGAWREFFLGPAEPTRLVTPHAVAVDATGTRVAVADTHARQVVVFNLSTHEVHAIRIPTTVGAELAEEYGVSGDERETHSCEYKNEPIVTGDKAGIPVGVAWLDNLLAVADAQAGHILILDPFESRPMRVAGLSRRGPSDTESPHLIRTIGQGQLQRPAGLATGLDGRRLYVSDAAGHCIFGFDRNGQLLFQTGSRGSAPGHFNYPSQLAVAPDGALFVADTMNFRIQRLSAEGSPISAFGRKGDAAGDLALPKGVAVDPDGNVWVIDAHFENVQAFTGEGQLLMSLGREGDGPGEFSLPAGIHIDPMRRVWIADSYNRRVQIFELMP